MPFSELLSVMQSFGLHPRADIPPGKWHRFPGISKKPGNKAGYCYLFPDGLGAVFGDFSSGLREIWQAEKAKAYTPEESAKYHAMVETAQKRAQETQEQEWAKAAERARTEWESLPIASDNHSYLQRKRVKAHGLRLKDGCLVMPIFDSNGVLTSYQSMSADGEKKLMYGGRKKGCAYFIPGTTSTVYMAEGYATGASIHEATGCAVIVAVDAGNLLPVAREAVKKYQHIILCADNDGAGIDAAHKVEAETGISYIYPEGIDGTDFNDMASELGLSAVASALSKGRMVKTYKKKIQNEYPDEVLNPPGLLKDIADYYAATAIRPQPLFGVAAGLAIGSIVLGRRYRTEYRNYTSLYMIVAAKSGTGKDHVKQVCREIMKASGIAWMERGEGFTSSNTVIKSLEHQPLQLTFFEEIGLRLQEAAANNRSLSRGTFRKLLDIFSSCHSFSVSEEYADTSVHRVERPALTMVGLSTPKALTGAINESLIEQGFINRILPFISREERTQIPLCAKQSSSPPSVIVDWIKSIWLRGNLAENGMPCCPAEGDEIEVPFTPSAIEVLNRVDIDVILRSNELEKMKLDDMLSRNREITMRVALIAAVMDGSKNINERHTSWAWGLVRYLYERYIEEIRRNVSGSDYEKAKLEALGALRDAGEKGIKPQDMPRIRPWSKWPKKIRTEILTELRDSGLADIIRARTGKRGPQTEVWVALD